MPSELAKRRFCSPACGNLARRAVRVKQWVTMTCKVCQKGFEVTPGWVKGGRRRYCTAACRMKAHRANIDRTGKRHTPEARAKMGANPPAGARSSQWKGGRFESQGYTHVMISTLPEDMQALARQTNPKGKYILEHRAVAAAQLGRPITRDEVVHHVNGIKTDNRPENLVVVPRADHSVEHREIERKFRTLLAELEQLRAENADLKSQLLRYREAG